MKKWITFLVICLFAWIILSSYLYVCKVRDNCTSQASISESTPELPVEATPDVSDQDSMGVKSAALEALEYLQQTGDKVYYFDFASIKVAFTSDDEMYANKLISYLTASPDAGITIEGHSDNIGSPQAKQKIASLRAEVVQQYLVDKGVDATRIELKPMGDSEPASTNNTEEGRSRNRRVVIKLN